MENTGTDLSLCIFKRKKLKNLEENKCEGENERKTKKK